MPGVRPLFLALVLIAGCADERYPGPNATSVYGNVGQSCSPQMPCRPGLVCGPASLCEPGHTTPIGSPCTISAECQPGLQCLRQSCSEVPSAVAEGGCDGDEDCLAGLRCVATGAGGACAPEGTGDVGTQCTTSADCYAGLACTFATCQPVPAGTPSFGTSSFAGVECESAAAGNPVRAWFQVPDAQGSPPRPDFFSLPFPNDVRLWQGTLDLSGFPLPGGDILGFDPLAQIVDALSQSAHAWGAYPTVIFRFSGEVDFLTVAPPSGAPHVHWVDVTPGAAELGTDAGWRSLYDPRRTKFICPFWLALKRPIGAPLQSGHTYAVWLTTDVRARDGSVIERSAELDALLVASPPADPVLAAAYPAYQPLRDYLGATGIDPLSVLNATVFTVGDVLSPMRELAALVEAGAAPTSKSWVRCGPGIVSPCPQATGNRACGDPNPDYDEYHALVRLPIFQSGKPPYLESGGRLEIHMIRQEDVCLALSVPRAPMPAAGWPLVIYAHGTGGSFRTHLRPEVAGALAHVTTSEGVVRMAVLGIDQVEHGPRRGTSQLSPDVLYFNFMNLDAARGNPLQGAADQLSLARFAASLSFDAATPASYPIRIDPQAIVFWGQSQGANEGSLALPFANRILGAVLSGNGASLGDSLIAKTKPVNIAAVLPYLLGGDTELDNPLALRGESLHPALTLVTQWLDPADPLHFARLAARSPPANGHYRHLFEPYGIGDSYAPPMTLRQYVVAAGLDQAPPDSSVVRPDDLGLVPWTTPVAGNLTVGLQRYTLVVRQYGPGAGRDGHFVASDLPSANQEVLRFLALAAIGKVPSVGQ